MLSDFLFMYQTFQVITSLHEDLEVYLL